MSWRFSRILEVATTAALNRISTDITRRRDLNLDFFDCIERKVQLPLHVLCGNIRHSTPEQVPPNSMTTNPESGSSSRTILVPPCIWIIGIC